MARAATPRSVTSSSCRSARRFPAKVKKGEVARAVIVRTSREPRALHGTTMKYDGNLGRADQQGERAHRLASSARSHAESPREQARRRSSRWHRRCCDVARTQRRHRRRLVCPASGVLKVVGQRVIIEKVAMMALIKGNGYSRPRRHRRQGHDPYLQRRAVDDKTSKPTRGLRSTGTPRSASV